MLVVVDVSSGVQLINWPIAEHHPRVLTKCYRSSLRVSVLHFRNAAGTVDMTLFSLPTGGFVIVDLKIEDRTLRAARAVAEQCCYKVVLSEVGGQDESFRTQSRVIDPKTSLRSIQRRLTDHARCFDPR